MEYVDFSKEIDSAKLILTEHHVGISIQALDWAQYATGSGSYQIPFTYGEIIDVIVNGESYQEEFSAAAGSASGCETVPESWYYDDLNKTLQIHCTDSDDPGSQSTDLTYKYQIVAIFVIGITNWHDQENKSIYEREDELLLDGGFDFWTSATANKYWTNTTAGTSTVERDSTEILNDKSAYSVKITIDAGGDAASVKQEIRTRPRRKNRIEINYMMTTAADGAHIRIYDTGANVYLDSDGLWQAAATNIDLDNALVWTEFVLEFVAHADYSDYVVEFRSATADSIVYFDGAKLFRIRQPLWYLPYLGDSSISPIYHAVGDYYLSDERMHSGRIEYIQDGWFYAAKRAYLWNNKKTTIRVGKIGSAYSELEMIFSGVCYNLKANDDSAGVDIADTRLADLTSIPIKRYSLDDYPNMAPSLEGKVIPFLLGEKTDISPDPIDITIWKYKISDTIFNGTTYGIEAINAVYADGVELTGGGVDYNADLVNGEFTLLIDPGNALITCDAEGLKIDFEDSTYSDLGADFAYFVLVILNSINELDLNIASFLDYKTNRTQSLGVHQSSEIDTLEFLKVLKSSTVAHVFPLIDGEYVARRYKSETPDDAPIFCNQDYYAYDEFIESKAAFKSVTLKYDKNPRTGEWKKVTQSSGIAEYQHDVDDALIVETFLVNDAEAETFLDFYVRLVRNPPEKIECDLPERATTINPADKAKFNRSVVINDGSEYDLLVDEVYRILEITRNVHQAAAEIVGIKDIDSLGFSWHSDEAHVDEHTDSYSDTHQDDAHADGGHADLHSDSEHADSYTDSHSDTAHIDQHGDSHVDEAHSNYHIDQVHLDGAHQDAHSDSYNDYDDEIHVDNHVDEYSDVEYLDDPYYDSYSDVDHVNTHSDSHNDQAHVDSYADSHTDTAHVDSYADAEHADSAHVDVHSDSYADDYVDEAHVDSYI